MACVLACSVSRFQNLEKKNVVTFIKTVKFLPLESSHDSILLFSASNNNTLADMGATLSQVQKLFTTLVSHASFV